MGAGSKVVKLGDSVRKRAAVLVDVENIVGPYLVGSDRPDRVLRRTWTLVDNLVRPVWSVAACHRRLAREIVRAAYDCGLRVFPGAAGPNRADRALVDHATTDLPAGIETVVLVSGDGDFVPLVWQQQMLGRELIVVSRDRSLSRELANAADAVYSLDDLDQAA